MPAPTEQSASTNLTLRRPEAIDYKAIASWVSSAEACRRWAGPRVSFPFSATDLQTQLSMTGAESYCLSDGPATVYGFGQFWVATLGAVHLGRIIISPEMRGQGFGRKLCRQLMEKAAQQTDARRITLRVFRDNTPALALYSSLGFVPVARESTGEVLFMEAAVQQAASISARA